MVTVGVENILSSPLKRIYVPEGDVLHAIKKGDSGYLDFGEVYFSLVHTGAIKAWKRHQKMTLNLVVPYGEVHFTFVDEKGLYYSETIGDKNYVRLTVPPGLWFGFKGCSNKISLVMNTSNIPHDPSESERKKTDEIKYDWSKV